MEYFKNCNCVEELKKQYRALCFKYHPDINKSPDAVKTMQEINNEYDELFNKLKNVFKNKNGETYETEKEITETPEEFRNIINELIKLQGIEVELMGRWIWVTGETKQHKEKLKELKFRWCRKKEAWSWHKDKDSTFSRGTYTLAEIREKFGTTTYKKQTKELEIKAV